MYAAVSYLLTCEYARWSSRATTWIIPMIQNNVCEIWGEDEPSSQLAPHTQGVGASDPVQHK